MNRVGDKLKFKLRGIDGQFADHEFGVFQMDPVMVQNDRIRYRHSSFSDQFFTYDGSDQAYAQLADQPYNFNYSRDDGSVGSRSNQTHTTTSDPNATVVVTNGSSSHPSRGWFIPIDN